MAPFESLGTVSYTYFVATMAVSLAICEIFSVSEWSDLENSVMAPFDRPHDFLLVGHYKYIFHFRVI